MQLLLVADLLPQSWTPWSLRYMSPKSRDHSFLSSYIQSTSPQQSSSGIKLQPLASLKTQEV